MANFEGITACNGCEMKNGVEKYLEKFQFVGEDIHVEIGKNRKFVFYGYCIPNIFEAKDKDMENDVTEDFFKGLKKFVKGALEIHFVGHEKCRFPMTAQRVRITSKEVSYLGF